jgi:Thioredoxin
MMGVVAACVALTLAPPEATLRELYESGRPYEEFLAHAERRKDLWHGNTAKADGLADELVERARAIPGTWRLLVVAIDSCSDSVSTIPYLAWLAERVPNLDLRVVDPVAGRAVMEAHPTPDGRAATPTVVLLDEAWNEAGCFIERPKRLQEWLAGLDGSLSAEERYERKMEWYAENAGRETVREVVEVLEAAGSGGVVCG